MSKIDKRFNAGVVKTLQSKRGGSHGKTRKAERKAEKDRLKERAKQSDEGFTTQPWSARNGDLRRTLWHPAGD